jgi:hypothetical protein
MKLTDQQLANIKNSMKLANGNRIILLTISRKDNLPAEEVSSNIYRIDDNDEIIWQVKEIETKRPYDEDRFVFIRQSSEGEITAGRFSGFEYKIDPETGEAIQVGFNK